MLNRKIPGTIIVVPKLRRRSRVYIAGGIARRIIDVLARSDFRARFIAKGGLIWRAFPSPSSSIPTRHSWG
jgi:glucokinase